MTSAIFGQVMNATLFDEDEARPWETPETTFEKDRESLLDPTPQDTVKNDEEL